MLQRSLRLSRRPLARTLSRTGGQAVRVQHLVPIGAANPSIATILRTCPPSDGQMVTAVGSVRTVRNQKQRTFVVIGDGSTIHSLQAVLEPRQAEGLGTGTSVAISGLWRLAPKGKTQDYELQGHEVRILGSTDAETYPIQKKYHSAEYLRSMPHLRLRLPFNALLARLKSECDFLFAQYFRHQGFVRVQPPIITSSDCEGAGEVFTVSSDADFAGSKSDSLVAKKEHFFRSPKFLTVSSQLHLEALVHEHQKVWALSPTFRAEKSDTPRHVSEFWMLEAELRTENLADVMDLVEDMISDTVAHLKRSTLWQELSMQSRSRDPYELDNRQQSEVLHERWDGMARRPWRRIKYADAMERLQQDVRSKQAKFQYEPLWEHGLQLEHEKYIAACFGQGSPVFVTDYPIEVKPFYMLPADSTEPGGQRPRQTVACFDLLLPDGTEVVGGSVREHRLNELQIAMADHRRSRAMGVNTEAESAHESSSTVGDSLRWYLDLRRYGSVPHGGFGLGFDRLIGYLAGVANIRDVVAWPRYYGRCEN